MDKITKFLIASPENNFRPPVLSYKAFLIYGLILLLLRLFLGALPTKSAAVESNTLMSLVNQERNQRNLTSLLTHQSLLVASQEKSQDMIDRDYFAHIDPDGNYVWGKIVQAGYPPYKILGENLAVDFSTSEGMVKAWIASPTHRANLLHPDFVDQGLSALYGDYQGRYTNLTTSLFGTLAAASATPNQSRLPAKTPSPPPSQVVLSPPPESKLPAPSPTAPSQEPLLQPSPTPPSPKSSRASLPSFTPPPSPVSPTAAGKYPSVFVMSRLIFTLFGILLLLLLAVDSVIIYQHELRIARSHSSYHFFGFMLIVLISILVWWW